jgi:hypothetical protein
MSQLHRLINTCNPLEFQAIEALPLRGKEKQLFDFTLKYRNSELPDNTEITKELDLSDTHLYKINSVLIRKCFDVLVPSGDLELLDYLKRKNLVVLLKHEMAFLEKEKLAANDKHTLEVFYLKCFHLLIDIPFKYYDKKLAETAAQNYLSVKKDRTLSDELYIKFHLLFADINRAAASKSPHKGFNYTLKDLQQFEADLENTTHYLARFYLYRTFCSYYNYYEKDNTKILAYLNKAIALKDHIKDFFPLNIDHFLRLLYADGLFQNYAFEESYSIYTKVYEEKLDEKMYGYYYHYEQYVLLAIILKHLDKAVQTLVTVFQPCIDSKLDVHATRGALAYVKYYLTLKEFKQTLGYLKIVKDINEKVFYQPFDIQIRVLENLYFFHKADYEFALALANRNLKFINAQEETKEQLSDYSVLFKIIIGFINQYYRGKTGVPEKYKEEFERIGKQYRNLYCDLIADMRIIKPTP